MSNSALNAYEAYDSRPVGGGRKGGLMIQNFDDKPVQGSLKIPLTSLAVSDSKRSGYQTTTYQKKKYKI